MGTQGFSPRARKDATLIRFGAEAARVTLAGAVADTTFTTDTVLSRHEGRRVDLNGERLSSSDRLRNELATLVFTPDRLAVVKGGPSTRRAYVDRTAGRLIPARATLAAEYASALAQRNAGLRRVRAGVSTRDALTPWTSRAVELGSALVETRREALHTLMPAFARSAEELGLDGATLAYEGDVATEAALESRLADDIERGVTGAGPHLHDVRIEAAGRDLRSYGSQGEQRMAVLSLVLAEAHALRERTGTSPLVLLDDVLSELDGDRRRALAGMLEDVAQTVVTATAAAALPVEPALSLTVSPGTIT